MWRDGPAIRAVCGRALAVSWGALSRSITIIQREGENFLIRIITPEEYFDKIIPALILIEEDLASGADLYVFGDKPLIYMFGRFLGDGVGPRHAELLQNACLAYR